MSQTFDSIVITGGAGMLAHALGHELSRRGLAFTAVDSKTCDVTDAAAVQRLFDDRRPTLLFNCAAYTNVDRCEIEADRASAVNGHAVGHLAEAARRRGTKVVHVSTDFVFDGSSTTPYRPGDATNPLSAYGRSKLLGEQRLAAVNPAGWLIVRTAWLYGPNGNCFPKTMLNAARAGKPLRVVADQQGTPTYTLDLAAILLDLVAAGASGIYHGANGGRTNWHAFTQTILDRFGLSADLAPLTSADWQTLRPQSAIRPAFSVLDTTDTARHIGRDIPDWRDAFDRYVANHSV